MKRALAIVLGTALVALGVVVAPALSARPYLPEPVEFEMAAPGAGGVRAARAGRPVVSAPVRAPRRFNLVGLRWTGDAVPAVAVRVRAAGKSWGRWTPVGTGPDHNPDPGSVEATARGISAPVWAGESDELQYRLSRPVPGLRFEFVNTTGSTTRTERVRTAMRGAVNRLAVALLTPASANAAAARPNVVPRAAWGAGMCQPRRRPGYGAVRMAFVHHTVTATSYSPAQARSAVLAICRFHRNSNGWEDIGYNFLVDRYGTIYEGRNGGLDRPVVGAQAQGWNAQSTGIANLGTFTATPQTPQAIRATAQIIRWKLPLHGNPTAGKVRLVSSGGATARLGRGQPAIFNRVSGHRDGNKTTCPGGSLYSQLPSLRSRVGNLGPAPGPAAAPTPEGGASGGDDGGGFTGAR